MNNTPDKQERALQELADLGQAMGEYDAPVATAQPDADKQLIGKLRSALYAIAFTLDDHELRQAASDAYDLAYAPLFATNAAATAQAPAGQHSCKNCLGVQPETCAFNAQAPAIKDHVIAQTVNELRDIAIQFHGAQQLRERIAHVVVPLLKAAPPSPPQQESGIEQEKKR